MRGITKPCAVSYRTHVSYHPDRTGLHHLQRMTTRESSNSRLDGVFSERTVPVDMLCVVITVLVSVIFYYLVSVPPVRFLVSVPLLFFIPGYVLVGILFPRHGGQSPSTSNGSLALAHRLDRVTGPERAALSVGLSVALVPFIGFLLELLPVAAFSGAIMPAMVSFALIGSVVASIRRLRLPTDEQFSLPLGTLRTAIAAPFTGPMPRFERVVTIGLAGAVLLAVVAVGYAFAVPQQGEQFTDLRIVTESPNGELTLGNYPGEVPLDESTEFLIGIDNREGQQQTYTLVVTADQIIEDGGSVTTIETVDIDRTEITLDNGERRHQSQTVTPSTAGAFRLNYYLYKGDAPAEPDTDTAYRHVYFTMTAVGDGSTATEELSATDGDFDIDGTIGSAVTVEDPPESAATGVSS